MRDEVRNGEWERAGAYDAAAAQFAVPAAQRLVERSRLHDTLAACLGSTVTLVSAPAGWGKTMLVASWLSARPPDYPCVWITVSATDDDPRSFWLTVATGLASSVGEPVVTALRDVRAAAATELPGRIAAALTAAGPVLLVLDNLHELRSAAVHDGLLRLVDRPPKGLRVVATTRQDPPWPLDRLRIAGVLRTVSSEELAFRPEEAGAMLSTAGTELAPDLLGELLERTEGWAAALRLAALELAVSRDAAALVATFSGDDHSVAGYLLTEVLARAAPPARDLLGKICVLDLVCADLADAVTGGSDGAVRLAELEASNLFVHSVGRPGRWYQLHRLVADVLRGQLTDPRQRRDLHRRAAEWHRQQGMPLEAVRYALRGGLWRLAADIVGVHVVPLTVVGSARALDLELSSAPREVVWAHPELACGLAAARLMQGLGEEVGDLLGAARAGLADLPSSPARRTGVVLDLIEAGYGRYAGDLGQVIAACRRVPDDIPALRSLGLVDWPLLRIVTLSNLGAAQTWTGEHLEAEKHLRAAIETERWGRTLLPHLNAKAHLALLHYERGDLGAAEGDGLAAIDQANGLGWARTVQAAAAHLALAGVHLDRDELAAADEWLGWVADIDDITPEPHIQLVAAGWGAARRAATGELEQALVGLRAAIGRAERDPVPAPLTDRLLLLLSQLLCGRRDRRGAAAALAAVRDPESPEAVMGAARIQLLGDDPQGAQRLLDRIEPDGGSIRLQVARRVLMALAAEARDDADLALECLEEALLAAAPQRLRRPFLDVGAGLDRLLTMRIERGTEVAAFAVDLVQHASGQVPRPAAGPVEPLTTREQVVLRYLPSALSNAEIAAELYVSVNTVKSQQRTLYRKLAAEGRRDAVRRARELHLL